MCSGETYVARNIAPARTRVPSLRKIIRITLFAAVGLAPNIAQAQMGWFAAPSLLAAEVYDDNLFFSPSQREQDRILRLSPAIEAGYRSDPLSVRGRYTFDAERYAQHPQLDSNQAREQAGMDFRYRPTHRLTVATEASVITTQTPAELNLDTGLGSRRVQAERQSIG